MPPQINKNGVGMVDLMTKILGDSNAGAAAIRKSKVVPQQKINLFCQIRQYNPASCSTGSYGVVLT